MPRGEHRPSILLSRDENEQVFSLIGPKCQSLATAVVQLFTTEGPAHSEWKKKDTGVLCLIKDNGKRSYFFRIYCLYRKSMIWEHEVYMQIEYKNPRPYLHTFEAEEYMTAFNFANEDEAEILKNILIDKIETRKNRREGKERRQRSMLATRANSGAGRLNGLAPSPPAASPPAPPPEAPPEPPPAPLPPKPAFPSSNYNTLRNTGKKPKRGKLTKADIGSPQDFKHISHVGWDANKGFDVGNLPNDELRSFFSMAGVSDTQLEDDDTREFIYDFIESHGGINAVKENLHEVTPPRGVPTRAPPVPARGPAQAPAPPSRAPPPPPPARLAPPPSPPPAPRNPPPPRPSHPPSSAPPTLPPPPPPGPPPPPPPPGAPPPPPAPPAAPPPPDAAPDARAALMESIRSGSSGLKRVEVNSKPPPSEDNRSNLLSEIRQGIELKSVSRSGSSPGERPAAAAPGGTCALAVALKLALDKRNQAIHSESDSDDSDNTTSDGEWDD